MNQSDQVVKRNARPASTLNRRDLVRAIETARTEGYTSTLDALKVLLSTLDELVDDGYRVQYRTQSKTKLQ